MKKKIKLDSKFLKILGVILILSIVFFCYSSVKIYTQKRDKKIEKLEEVVYENEKKEIEAKRQRDSALFQGAILAMKIDTLQSRIRFQNMIMNEFHKDYIEALNKLENYKNEENHIPNASPSEQFNFISNYRYRKYEMPSRESGK